LATVLFLGTAFGLTAILSAPERFYSADYLVGDGGWRLSVIDALVGGAVLYEDIFWPYGPLSISLESTVAAWVGNTVGLQIGFAFVGSLVCLALVYRVFRTCADSAASCFLCVVGVIGVLMLPGAVSGAGTSGGVVERALLLVLILLWVHPGNRGTGRTILTGLSLGLYQFVKFGGAAFAGVAIVLLDLVALWLTPDRGELGRWLKSMVILVGSFLSVELVGIVAAFLVLPSAIALDVIWPLYYLQQYDWITDDLRWISIDSIGLLVGHYVTPLVGTALGLVGLALAVQGLRRSQPGSAVPSPGGEDRDQLRIFLPLFIYAVFLLGYMPSVFHQRGFMWLLVLPAIWLVARTSRTAWWAYAVLLVPSLTLALKIYLVNPPDEALSPLRVSTGETLYVTDALARTLSATFSVLGAEGIEPSDGLMFYPNGGGMNHFYRVPRLGRHAHLMSHVVREYEREEFLHDLGQMGAVVLRSPSAADEQPSGNPCAWQDAPRYSEELCAAIADLMAPPVRAGPEAWVFPIR
jgi:hypothetical protein